MSLVNTKEIYRKGHMYVVTRRIIQRKDSTVLRVRVRAWTGLITTGAPMLNEYRDYAGGDMARGDMVFFGHIAKIESF